MNKYEKLLDKAYKAGIDVDEGYPFNGKLSGLYVDGNIALSDKLETSVEKGCIMVEELGHHYTTAGDITDLSKTENRKQEHQARLWAYNEHIWLKGLIAAYEHGCHNSFEIAEYLEVTEEFLQECICCYREKYGVAATLDSYCIMFIPHLAIGKVLK